MNFRQTAILFAVVFTIGVVLLILSFRDEGKPAPGDVLVQELAVAGAKTPDIDSVEFERPDGVSLLMVRTDKDRNTWQIQKPITAAADAAKILPVITALMKAKPTPYNELTSNPALHGLEPPSLKVILRSGDKSSTINFGDVTLGEKGVVFVTTSAQPKRPMAVRRSDVDALFRVAETAGGTAGSMAKWTSDFRAPNVFPADSHAMGEDVASIDLSLPNQKKELKLSRHDSGGWKFDTPAGWGDADTEGASTGAPTIFTGVAPLLRSLVNVTAAAPTDFIDNPKDLKEYGLNADNPNRIRVAMKTRDGQTAVVYFGKAEAGAAPPPMIPGHGAEPAAGGKVYVQIEGQSGVIHASASNLPALAATINNPDELRDRDLIHVSRTKQVDGLDIILAGQAPDKPTKLRKVGGDWKLYGGLNDPQNAYVGGRDPIAGASPIVNLLGVHRVIKGFPAPNPAVNNFAAISATLYVWVDGFNPPADPKAEPAKKSEPVKLEFGRVDGETVYVRRTLPGQPSDVVTLPTSVKIGISVDSLPVVATVSKTRLDLLDRTLPTFSGSNPVKITAAGAVNYVLAGDDKPDPMTRELLWRFVAPDPRAGQVADATAVRKMILDSLSLLSSSVTTFVDEEPTPAKLAEYGFTPNPRLKVTVDLPPETAGTKQFVFEFGKDAADPDKVYARVSGRAAVFTVQRLPFENITKADLRDRVVFRSVPAAQVNSLEMTGWGGIMLKFEKNKDGVWTSRPPTPPAFAVDPAKVTAFINALTTASAKSFEKGPPDDKKYGFTDPKAVINVVMKWPGGQVLVNLGATPDGGQTYYGWTTHLPAPEQIFIFDGAPFKPFKESTGGFAK